MTSSEQYGSTSSTGGDVPASGGYPAGGYVPPAESTGSADNSSSANQSASDQSSAKETAKETAAVAKDQASSVAGGAADAASHVAGVAKEQVGEVTAEAGRQVKELVGHARTQLTDQVQSQQLNASIGLYSLSDQLKAMASNSEQSGVATDLAQQAAGKVRDLAGWLENREPAEVLNEVRKFARQRPGAFLAIALGAGVVAGRLARGMATNPDEMGDDSKSVQGAAAGYDRTPGTYGIEPQSAGYVAPQPYGLTPAAPDYATPGYATPGYANPASGYPAPGGGGGEYGGQHSAAPGTPYGTPAPGYETGQDADWAARQSGQWGETR